MSGAAPMIDEGWRRTPVQRSRALECAGYDWHRAGGSVDACPYSPGEDQELWLDGYNKSYMDSQDVGG